MVLPIDYTMNVLNPFEAALGGFQAGQNIRSNEQGMQLAQNQDQRQAQVMEIAQAQEGRAARSFGMDMRAADAAQARAMEMQSALAQLAEKPDATARDYEQVLLAFPEISDELTPAFERLSEDQRRSTVNEVTQLYSAVNAGRADIAQDLLEQRLRAAENAGDTQAAQAARINLEILKTNPDAFKTTLGLELKAVGGDEFDGLLGGGGFDVQSSQIIGGNVSIQTGRNGQTRVVDMTTNEELTGAEAAKAIRDAQDREAEMQRDRALGRGIGTETVNLGVGALEDLGNATASIRTIDEAIAAIDDGASAGAISKFLPNVTKASASLENAMNRMGLDVIGSVTFGALSEAEMTLAMETAVPRNLGPQALRQWLVEKRNAQRKAAEALQNAARILLQEGDLSAYIEGRLSPPGTQQATQPVAPTDAPAPPPAPGIGAERRGARSGADLSEIERGIMELERMLGGAQ